MFPDFPRDNSMTNNDLITACVSGQTFVIRRACLHRLPNSRLYMLAMNPEEHGERLYSHEEKQTSNSHFRSRGFSRSACTIFAQHSNEHISKHDFQGKMHPSSDVGSTENLYPSQQDSLNRMHAEPIYYFDRDPEIFRFVLDYYRTGELHLPSNICGPFVRKELIYWGIDESYILPCCMPAYMRYEEERRVKKTLFRDCFEDIDSMKNLVNCCRGWKRWRYRIWLFLDHPTSSWLAKIWASILSVLVIASVMCYCVTTHKAFRRPIMVELVSNTSELCNPRMVAKNPKLHKDCTTLPANYIIIFDLVLNIVFSLEWISKLIIAPDRKKFFCDTTSIIDLLILITFWVNQVVYYLFYVKDDGLDIRHGSEWIPYWLIKVLNGCQALRILRIFKISKISRGLRVLILTVKKSIPELVLLAFLLMNGMFMFSSMVYMAEYNVPDTFSDIPAAFWWSIITLTTVGYGDVYPKGGAGYVVGSVAAISGCVVTGLAIPIIGNNFNTYYKYMQNQLKEDKYLRMLRKNFSQSSNMQASERGGRITPTNRKYLQLRGELKPGFRNNVETIARRRMQQQQQQQRPKASQGTSQMLSGLLPMQRRRRPNLRRSLSERRAGDHTSEEVFLRSDPIDSAELPDKCLGQEALDFETDQVTMRLSLTPMVTLEPPNSHRHEGNTNATAPPTRYLRPVLSDMPKASRASDRQVMNTVLRTDFI